MSGYTPLFGEIVTSSIWNEDAYTCKVWVTLMALADIDGNVFAAAAGLAPVARVSIEQCKKAIQILSSPDPESRSDEQEGRRIIPIEGGWHIVNHAKYRKKAKSRAEYIRQWRLQKKKEIKNNETNETPSQEKKKGKKEKNIHKLNSYSNSVTGVTVAQQSVTGVTCNKKDVLDPPDKGTPEQWAAFRERGQLIEGEKQCGN